MFFYTIVLLQLMFRQQRRFSFAGQELQKSITFDISSGKRPHIMVDILSADDRWVPVRLLADTGNDVTLLNEKTAQDLGLTTPEILARAVPFKVQGIAAAPMDFMMIKRPVRMGGSTTPIEIKIGVGPLRENLLGREDVLDKFEMTFTKSKLKLTQLRDNTIPLYEPTESKSRIKTHLPQELELMDRQSSPVFANWR